MTPALSLALAVLLWLAIAVVALLVLGLLLGVYNLARWGDARGRPSAYARDLHDAWWALVERAHRLPFRSSSSAAPDVVTLVVVPGPMNDRLAFEGEVAPVLLEVRREDAILLGLLDRGRVI